MLVVTGRPGSGKSALLGNVLIRSSPRWRPVLEKQGWSGEPWAPDGGEVFDAALNLSGLFTREVVQRLTEALGVAPAGSEAGWSGADIEHLVEKLAGRRFTVMVDGLDEAVDPGVVAGSVLRRLAAQPHGRIVVGTRLSGDDQIDGPPAGRAEILEALGSSLLIPVTRDAGALAAYVRRRLAQVPPVGAAALTAAEVEQVAALVSGRDDEVGFLYARLVTHEVLADPDLARSGRLPDLLAGDHQAIFRHALDRLDRTTPRALALLKALAFTAGPGLPRSEHTWASVATAFSGGQPVTEADIDLLLERAAPYVTVDAGYGVSVYRLAHQIYRAVLGTDTR
jgi:hypothetical protein